MSDNINPEDMTAPAEQPVPQTPNPTMPSDMRSAAAQPPTRHSGDPITEDTVDVKPDHPAQQGHSLDSADSLLRVYLEKRLGGQQNYYKRRIEEFESNTSFMITVGAGIMALSSFVSAVGVALQSPLCALTTALIPAFAALVASLRQLYQWEKQAAVYRDAELGLEETRLLVPDIDLFDPRSAPIILPMLVRNSEQVFESEINQWGQIALGIDKETEDQLNKALLSLGGGGEPVPEQPVPSPPTRRTENLIDANFDDGGVG